MTYATAGRAVLAGAALTAVVTLAGCGTAESRGDTPMAPSSGGASVNPTFGNTDAMFVRMTIPHHEEAVEMAFLAGRKAAAADVRQLAARIGAEQAAEIATMRGWADAWSRPTTKPSCPGMHCMPSGMMPSGMPGMPGMMPSAAMTRLKAANGAEFDALFLRMMTTHHQEGIRMAQAESAHGTNPDAKALAGHIVKTQQAEIDEMRRMAGQLHS